MASYSIGGRKFPRARDGNCKTVNSKLKRSDRTRQAAWVVVEQLERRLFLTVTASASGASSVNESSPYTLNLSASSTTGTISSVSINWGDGTQSSPDIVTYSGNPSSESHTYAKGPNNYTITATATDSTNATGSATQAVTVNHVAPALSMSPSGALVEGSSFLIYASSAESVGEFRFG